MRCAPRWRSSCGRSNARATSWRSSPTRGSPCSAASTPCRRRASCRNIPRASPRSRSRACSPAGTRGSPDKVSSPASRSTSTSTPCPTSASIRSFLAQDADAQVFCYSNADIRKGEEAEEVFRFIEFWKRQYGKLPQHLVFDSKLTTYQGLDRLDAAGITFLTLRRRSPSLIAEVDRLPPSAWRTITLDVPHRKYRKPRVFEQKARPRERTYRQFFITDLGHDEPTILLTNDAKSTAQSLVTRYAKRMLIENALADAVRFFHIDALSSSVGFKVDFDMALLVLASGLYRLMARRMRGYNDAQAR